MGRLKLQMQITVDGFNPAGRNGDLSWDEVRDYSRDLLDSADTILLGSRTAPDFIPAWDKSAGDPNDSWHGIGKQISAARKIVFSKSTDHPAWPNTVVENGDLAEAVNRLKRHNDKDMIVYGGVAFVTSLVRLGLIDEYHLFMNPVAAGSGYSIFSGLESPQPLRLRKAIGMNSGHVLLHYE